MLQQQGEAFIQAPLAVFRRGHAVKTHQRMQAEPGQGVAPFRLAVLRAADKVEHWQQRLAATGQHAEFVAVFGQHRLAGVDHIQSGVRGQQLAQHFGFLFKPLARFAAVEKTCDPRRAVKTFAGAVEAFQIVEQGDGVFQPRRVVQLQQRFAVHRQPSPFHVPGGAGAMGHFAKADIAGEGTQQRGFADIGVADHGQRQWLSHGLSPAS